MIFAITPVRSILSNWSDNEQRGHLFGYWFGHDMFTPPFGLYPEMTKDAILFGGTDPGRFCPTYMIFCESFIPPRCKPRDPKFDRRDVYIITQNALADHTYLNYIRAHYNRSTEHDPYFFSDLVRTDAEIQEGRTNLLSRMLLPLDYFFTNLGQRIEKARAPGAFTHEGDSYADPGRIADRLPGLHCRRPAPFAGESTQSRAKTCASWITGSRWPARRRSWPSTAS